MNTIFTVLSLGWYDTYHQNKASNKVCDEICKKVDAALSEYGSGKNNSYDESNYENIVKLNETLRKGNNEIRARIATM
jgi:hypothetical protein